VNNRLDEYFDTATVNSESMLDSEPDMTVKGSGGRSLSPVPVLAPENSFSNDIEPGTTRVSHGSALGTRIAPDPDFSSNPLSERSIEDQIASDENGVISELDPRSTQRILAGSLSSEVDFMDDDY
jgi:hypothetical protein